MSPLDIQQDATTVFIAKDKAYDEYLQTTKTIGKGAQRNYDKVKLTTKYD